MVYMATIVNTPASSENNASGVGFIIGALIVLFAVFMFFYYGIPAMRTAVTETSPSITVPEQVDVNVTTPQNNSQPNPAE